MGAETTENGGGDAYVEEMVTKPGENDVLCGKLLCSALCSRDCLDELAALRLRGVWKAHPDVEEGRAPK